jgi:DNA-binding NarL/FixJ family response regulator
MFLKDNILEFLDIELNDNELEVLKIIKKQSINKILKVENQKDISEFLKKEYSNKKERNEAIIQAYKQGFKKSEIARFLNVSLSLISKITK